MSSIILLIQIAPLLAFLNIRKHTAGPSSSSSVCTDQFCPAFSCASLLFFLLVTLILKSLPSSCTVGYLIFNSMHIFTPGQARQALLVHWNLRIDFNWNQSESDLSPCISLHFSSSLKFPTCLHPSNKLQPICGCSWLLSLEAGFISLDSEPLKSVAYFMRWAG